MTATSFDVIVVGGGPAGVTAALRARELGAGVALVERGLLGGTCTNDGCVPTRVLAKAARLARDAEQHPHYGLEGAPPTVDFARLLARAQGIVYRVHEKKQAPAQPGGGRCGRLRAGRRGAFVDPHTLALADGTHLAGRQFILCVGGHARRLSFPGSELALTHSDIWSLERCPSRWSSLGPRADRLPTRVDLRGLRRAGDHVGGGAAHSGARGRGRLDRNRRRLRASGCPGHHRHRRRRAHRARGQGALRLAYTRDGAAQTIVGQAVVLAVGWPGAVEGLELEAAGVTTARGYVTVDDTLRTTAPHIFFAAGDITGRMMLVQSATGEGTGRGERLAGRSRSYRHGIVPHGGFTDPEYASVGLTEAQARMAHARWWPWSRTATWIAR